MNRITIFGRLTADVETRTTNDGKTIATLKIASDGRNKDEVDFFTCKSFGAQADTLAKYYKKGDPILLFGNMHLNKWQKQDGTNVETWECLVNEFVFLPRGDKRKTSVDQEAKKEEPVEDTSVDEGDLPF